MYPSNHDFLQAKIDRLHDTPMQRKVRKLAPMPCGVVFLPWPGMTEAEARQHFRWMKELGFTCLKQTMPTPEWPTEKTLLLALEEGIIPYWYGEGGWQDITPALLTRLGLPADLDIDAAMAHPAMIAHQHGVIRERILRRAQPVPAGEAAKPALGLGVSHQAKAKDVVAGMVGTSLGHELPAAALPHFAEWLKRKYGTFAALKEAWNYRHVGILWPAGFADFADLPATYEHFKSNEFCHLVDAMRFRADMFLEQHIRAHVDQFQAEDAEEPTRAGGEMGVFLPFASRGTDMEGIALEMARGGSFYPSLHLAWHFEEVEFEVARPVYLQAAMSADWAKGIWSATWESTGGPQYFSGGKAPFVPEARDKIPGFTTDEHTMTQLVLSYLGAGFRGFGMWAWNYRTAGWEGGEYSMVGRNLVPGPRARTVGLIAQAMRRLRRELWQSNKEPLVGVLYDWDNEATWAAMAVTGRDRYKNEPVRARIGMGRALLDANIPWEHVTVRNLRAGLAARYPVIICTAQMAISSELWAMLKAYVRDGGRLVMDMPSAYYDEFLRIIRCGPGTPFERLFGCVLDDLSYSTPLQKVVSVDGVDIQGFTAAITPTAGRVAATFNDGAPAIIEHQIGTGSAVLLAFQAGMTMWKPGSTKLQDLVIRHALGSYQSPYRCAGALCYRLAGPQADHYFLINPDGDKHVVLDPWAFTYARASDPVTGQAIDLTRPIPIAGHGGRWIRCEK